MQQSVHGRLVCKLKVRLSLYTPHGQVKIYTHSFLTLALYGGQWSASCPGHFTLDKKAPSTNLCLFQISSHSIRTAYFYQWILDQLTLNEERKIIWWVPHKVIVIYTLLINTRNLLNQTQYATCFGQPWHLQAPCKLAVIYIMPLNTPNSLNLTLYAICFNRPWPSSGSEGHNLQNSSAHVVF
jgi:hypothetical protein